MAKEMKPWGLILFGIPFLAVGLGVLIWSLCMWKLYHESGEWEKVPARIESSSFEVHHGDDSTSYSVLCSYSYNYAGKNYHGNKVGMESGGSSDSYHRRRYEILNQHKTGNRPFEALVNPLDPSQSVLFREITTTMYVLPLFGLVFGLAGAAVMTGGVISTIKSYSGKAMLAANPGKPWLADTRWQSPVLRDNPLPKIIGTFAMAVFICIFLSMFVIAILQDGNAPNFAKMIIGGFCLIPVGMFISVVYQTMRYIKYGRTELVLSQLPFVPGRLNTATLNIPSRVEAQEGLNVSLKCFRRVWEKSGKNNSIHEYEEFSIDQTVIQDPSGLQNSILMSFRIPENVQQTHIGTFPEYAWRIIAAAKTPGVDFKVQFDVPVYKI